MNQMVNTMEQKNTIINLYNSGIEPEIISLELDLDKDIVIQVIENETNRKVSEQSNNLSDSLNSLYLEAVIDINSIIKESQVRTWQALKVKPDFNISIKDTQNVLEK